jgi:hypothetical protein
MFRVRTRLARSAARFGTHGSIASLSRPLVRIFSTSMLDGIPPMLCGVLKSGTNPGSTPRNR